MLRVSDLHVRYDTEDGVVHAVDGISLSVERGRTTAIVGESGSGKSAAMLAIMRLLPSNATVSGRVMLGESDLLELDQDDLPAIRGKRIAMVFQDPLASLNPYMTIGRQLEEALQAHDETGSLETRAVELLTTVGIPEPRVRAGLYPHQLSGGMRQRVMIAMAMSCWPDILIADEPTTALDVSVQAQILELMKSLQEGYGLAVILVTHDFGVVAGMADTVNVMYAGRIIESGTRDQVFTSPQHPYTWGLLAASAHQPSLVADRLYTIRGTPPSLISLPPGCTYHPRCECRFEPCDTVVPPLEPIGDAQSAACLLTFEERVANRRRLIGR